MFVIPLSGYPVWRMSEKTKQPAEPELVCVCVSKREPKPTNHFSNSSAAFASNRPSVYAALNLYGDPKRHRNIENRHFVLFGRSRRGKEQSNRSGSTPPPTVGGGQKKDRQHWKNPWYSFPSLSQERTCIAALLVQLVGGLRGEDRRLLQPDGRQCAANCDRVLQVPWWGRIRVWQVPWWGRIRVWQVLWWGRIRVWQVPYWLWWSPRSWPLLDEPAITWAFRLVFDMQRPGETLQPLHEPVNDMQRPETWPKDRWCREHVESTGGR